MVAKRVTQLFLPLMVFLLLVFGAAARAYAAPGYVNVSVSASGNGEVAINNYSYGAYAYDTVQLNDSVNLTALPSQYATFKGWWDSNAGHYVSYVNDIWLTATEDIDYVAVFEDDLFVLAAYAQPSEGGKIYCGAMSDMWVSTVDTSLSAGYYALDAYAEPGYNFMGWYDEYGGLISYNVPFYFDLTFDFYLHAEFQKVPDPLYWVYLDNANPEGGMVYGHMSSGNYGDWVNIDAVPNTGYVFAGWTETYSGFPVSAEHSYTFNIYNDQYYTAHFKPENAPCTIVTLPGEGSGLMPDYTVADGETFYLPECTFIAPPGKEFDEWNAGPVGTGIVMHSDMTITALWKDIVGYTVHVEPNGGTGYMPDPVIAPGGQYELPECTFTGPDGKVFDKWDVGAPGEKITVNAETWIYAQWKDATVYHLVYIDPNGATGYMADPYVEHGKEYTLPENGFTAPEGKEFAGWDVGKPGDKITVNADMSIYAQWKDKGSGAAGTGSSSSASTDPSGSSSSTEPSGSAASTSSDAASSGSASSGSSTASGSGSSASGTGSGGSSTNSGNGGENKDELPILPIAGGVAVGGGIVGLIAWLTSRRKKEEEDASAAATAAAGAATQATQPIEAAVTKPIEEVAKHVDHAHEEEGFED